MKFGILKEGWQEKIAGSTLLARGVPPAGILIMREMKASEVLNRLKRLNWERDTIPLVVDFLNLDENDLRRGYGSSELREDLGLDDLLSLHSGIRFVLESLDAGDNTEEVRKLLTGKWREAEHIVEVEGRRVYTSVPETDDLLKDMWLNFICFFLYSDWWERMGRCPACGKWFHRPRANRTYCSRRCKNRADYLRHQERRTAERRKRYQGEKEPSS